MKLSKPRKMLHGHRYGGMATSEYGAWRGMLYRTSSRKCKSYKYYGERGIVVCKRWATSFINFYKDVGPKPSPLHSIERINNN